MLISMPGLIKREPGKEAVSWQRPHLDGPQMIINHNLCEGGKTPRIVGARVLPKEGAKSSPTIMLDADPGFKSRVGISRHGNHRLGGTESGVT